MPRSNVSKQHLARHDFLLAFSYGLRSKWNRRRLISHQNQQAVIPGSRRKRRVGEETAAAAERSREVSIDPLSLDATWLKKRNIDLGLRSNTDSFCGHPAAIRTVVTARAAFGRVYVTARCPSVCPIYRLMHAAAAGLLLWARRAGEIDRSRRPPGATAARRRSAANASSVTLSADVGS